MKKIEEFSNLRIAIRNLIKETVEKNVVCSNCGWKWNTSDSEKDDMYVCHKCGNDNTKKNSLFQELKYVDLSSKEKQNYHDRNKNILQSKIKPINLKYRNQDVELTPKIYVSEDWISYSLSDSYDTFFSFSLKDKNEIDIYLNSKIWDYNIDEFNLGQNIISFLNSASDYVDFLDETVIKKIEKVINYQIRKKENYVNTIVKL